MASRWMREVSSANNVPSHRPPVSAFYKRLVIEIFEGPMGLVDRALY
jgi:hypothetical protein